MLFIALLAAQALPAPPPAPDIELNVRASVREVRLRQRGEASLEVHASPDAGSRVVRSPRPAPERDVRRRNVTVNVHGEARIANPSAHSQVPETSPRN